MNRTKDIKRAHDSVLAPFLFSTASSAHQEHPERNEDFLLVDRQRGLAVICDGVGSVFAADQAARLAARTIKKQWRPLFAQLTSQQSGEPSEQLDLEKNLHHLLEEANQAVCALAEQLTKDHQGEKQKYAATTIAAALFYRYPDRYTMIYAHVGDSRIYLLREQSGLQRLTVDDGYFLILMNKGEIDEQDALRIDQASSADQLSEKEREHFEKRNGITQALGDPDISIHVGQIRLGTGDRVLLCTDGIHDNLTDKEIAELMRKGTDTRAARRIVQHAITRSQQDQTDALRPKKDDMSAIVVTCLFPPETD